jgi:hypothetical protein
MVIQMERAINRTVSAEWTGQFRAVSALDSFLYSENPHYISSTGKQAGAGMCPRCNGALRERMTKSPSEPHRFFGCTNFPICRYTIKI